MDTSGSIWSNLGCNNCSISHDHLCPSSLLSFSHHDGFGSGGRKVTGQGTRSLVCCVCSPLDLVTWTRNLLIVYVSSCCCASSLLRFWVLLCLGLSEIFSQIVQVDEFHPVLMRAQKKDKHRVFQTEGFRLWANNLCKGTEKILSIQALGESWAM
jgi:hypothetical protein